MYKFLPADKGYINNVVERTDRIQWECTDNTISLFIVIKSFFGETLDLEDEIVQNRIYEYFEQIGNRDKFHIPDVGDVYIVNSISGKTIKISQEAATYSVFACRDLGNGNRVIYYYPKNGDKIERIKETYRFSVDHSLSINIKREVCRKKFRFEKVIKINIDMIENYINGMLYYTVKGSKTKYPITKELLCRDFYIQCLEPTFIEFFSTDNTLKCNVIDIA